MIDLSQDSEARALEHDARRRGQRAAPARHRIPAEQMLPLGSEIAALPTLDPRAPSQIIYELKAP